VPHRFANCPSVRTSARRGPAFAHGQPRRPAFPYSQCLTEPGSRTASFRRCPRRHVALGRRGHIWRCRAAAAVQTRPRRVSRPRRRGRRTAGAARPSPRMRPLPPSLQVKTVDAVGGAGRPTGRTSDAGAGAAASTRNVARRRTPSSTRAGAAAVGSGRPGRHGMACGRACLTPGPSRTLPTWRPCWTKSASPTRTVRGGGRGPPPD
jgi:hypothetical protein